MVISLFAYIPAVFVQPDGNTLIAGVCHQQQDANYCNQEVWVWDIPSYNLIQSPLLIGERYPLYMDVNDKNVLAVASCRHQQENETGFSCVKSEISFFDLDSDRFIYKPVLFEQMLGPLAFTADYSLIMSRCPRMNDIDNPCFPYVIQLIDIRTSNQIREPFSLEIDYPLDILAIDFDGIYFSACHESEDLGPCAQPRIWWWDIGYDEPVFYWRPDIMPTSLSMFEYDLLVLSPSAIEVQRLEEARIDFLLNLPPDKYSGMIFYPETVTAAVYHKSGIIQLINFGRTIFLAT